ncbi:MAG: glycosyltransferase family 2 protein [Thermodesulfovibrionales bacterium]|nr:glycosyltransferase family 2 protein [Thermodesulfovibrionales bacterium]
MTNPSPEFSIVIPICNEEENIPLLYKQLVQVMEGICAGARNAEYCFEIILVDDGSTDGSWELIRDLNAKDHRVKGISFSRNFGHHVALTAGLDYAQGRAIILMDGDLQDPPEEIPKLLSEFRKGFDLVYGIRGERNDPVMKKVSSHLFWWILRKFSGVDIPGGQTMLRILSRRLADALKGMREQARFIHGMMAWTGFNTTTVAVQHNPRKRGISKYDIPRMFKLAFHAVSSFSTVPLRLATYMGLFSSLVSLIIGLFFVSKKIFLGIPVIGFASVIVAIFFVGGIQLLVLGMFGEYIGRTYQEVQKRPLYIIRESLS